MAKWVLRMYNVFVSIGSNHHPKLDVVYPTLDHPWNHQKLLTLGLFHGYDITLQRLTHPQIAQLSYTYVIYLCLKSQDPRSAYGFTMFYIYFILLPSWQTWRFSVLKPTQHGSIVTIPRYGCSPLEDVLPPNKLYKTPKRMVLSSSKIIGNSPCQTFQVPLISTLHLDVEKWKKHTV